MRFFTLILLSFTTLALALPQAVKNGRDNATTVPSTSNASNNNAALNIAGTAKSADAGASTLPPPSAADQAAATGGDVSEAVAEAIAAQAADPAAAAALKDAQGQFITAAKLQSAKDNGAAIRTLAAPGGESSLAANTAPSAAQVQFTANNLALQTADVDRALQVIANPNSSDADIKKAGAQGLANELAQDDERALLAAGSKDTASAQALAASVGQVGPSTVLNAFTLISAGQGDTKALALAVVNAREQVVVPTNCALIKSGSGTDICATRVPINPGIFGAAGGGVNVGSQNATATAPKK